MGGSKEKLAVNIFPLTNREYLLSFTAENIFERQAGNFHINIKELDKIFPNEKLIEALRIIEKSFPLSVLEKKEVLKKLNFVYAPFWLADKNGKILLANNSLGEFDLLAPPLGEKENEIFPEEIKIAINELNRIINDYKTFAIKESVEVYGASKSIYDVAKFPVLNMKNEIEATCGIILNSMRLTLADKQSNVVLESIKKLPFPVALLNSEGVLIGCSAEFEKELSVGENEILRLHYSEIFTKDFSTEFEKFIFNEEKQTVEIDIKLDEKEDETKVTVKKIFNSKGIFIGSLIIFENKKNENYIKIARMEMIDELLNVNPEPTFIYDAENLKFLSVNDAAVEFYGYSKDDFLKMDLTDLYTPEDIQTLIEFNNSDKTTLEKPVKHKLANGKTAVVRLTRREIDYDDRKAFLTIVKDVTKNNEVNKIRRELNALSEVAIEALIETDADGFIISANRSVTKLLAYSSDEILGKTFISLLSENDRSNVNKKVFLNKTKNQQEFDISVKTKHGASKNVKLAAVPLFNIFEEIDGYALILVPKELIYLESKKKEVAPTSNVSNSSSIDISFLSHLFHELLTPINVIIGFTQELLESIDNPTPEQRESAQIIMENQRSLMQLIDAASEYAAIEQNQTRVLPEEFNIVEILDKIEENVKKIAAAHNVELKYGKISSSIVLNHDKHLTIMFLSLLWEFSVRGTKQGQVYFSAKPFGDKVQLMFKDGKNEISSELLKALNEFLTEDETLVRRNYNVSRFAVRLLRKLANLLGVEFTEIEKNGAIAAFAAILPANYSGEIIQPKRKEVASPKERSVSVRAERLKETEKREPKTVTREASEINIVSKPAQKQVSKSIDLSKLSCLLLEDQIDSQLLFKQQLKELKEIEVFARFEDALPVLRKKKFDFVVIDINLLGDYNGLEALREIKNIPQYRNVPIIASTAYMMPGDQDRYIEAGFDDFIPKPILKNKLLESLKKIL